MGVVLDAWDSELDRLVAIKLLPGAEAGFAFEQTVGEVRIAAQLEHPSIVPVYDVGVTPSGGLYFVMRKVAGTSLEDVLRGIREGDGGERARWTPHRLLGAFVSLCQAVAYAHEQGVVHRDIKPGNVMLGSFGEVQLLDWGVARRVDHEGESSPQVVGTPGYISPEQVLTPEIEPDRRSDVWSLGALLYEILTLRRAFAGESRTSLLREVAFGSIVDPRLRAPEACIPATIAAVCLRALSPRPRDRQSGADVLALEVERFLDGSKRREKAREHLDDARELWARHARLQERRTRLLARERELGETLSPWLPLEMKRELLDLRRKVRRVEPDRASLFARSIGCAERALSQDPTDVGARRFLASAYWSRFLEAEGVGDVVSRRYFAERVAEYDDGSLAVARRGAGRLTLTTSPAGAEVWCRRVDREPIPWELGVSRSLGRTPLQEIPLDMGSYVLTLRHPDHPDTTYPVHIERSGHWDSGSRAIELAPADLEDGFAYVAEGPCRLGGDAGAQDAGPRREARVRSFRMAEFPVTQGEYVEFINALAVEDPDEAWRRSPRQAQGVQGSGGQFWERPSPGEAYVVPEQDRDGDRWDPAWPVFGVSWEDAEAYAAWRSERDGVTYKLPTESQWEKAARGVDGRLLPWGDELDPSLCAMRASFRGRPQPRTVGLFETDVSVYGVRDLAGGVRDWCREPYAGDVARRPVRGGSWDSAEAYCRLAHRTGYLPTYVSTSFGFRLVREV